MWKRRLNQELTFKNPDGFFKRLISSKVILGTYFPPLRKVEIYVKNHYRCNPSNVIKSVSGTIWHEVMHYAIHYAGLNNGKKEHYIIDKIERIRFNKK